MLTELLANDNYIIVNKSLIKSIGLYETILLGELCSEYNYWNRENKLVDGMFYSTQKNIEENTGLSEYQQRNALDRLKSLGIIKIRKEGMPAKNYYMILEDKLFSFLRTSALEIKEQVPEKFDLNNNKRKIINNNKSLSKDKDNIEPTNFLGSASKKSKSNLYRDCINYINFISDNEEVKSQLILFLNSLVEMGKLRGRVQFEGILKKLKNHPPEEQIRMIEYTLEKGYSTFYELKDSRQISKASSDMGREAERMTDEQKRKFKEDIKNGNAEKF